MLTVQTALFVCDVTPFAVWSLRMEEENLQCLNSIDPDYFKHISAANKLLLESENRHYASVQLRTAYSMALETLFALIGCVVQAPHCPAGWLLCYHSGGLYNLIRNITNRQPILTMLQAPLTWEILAKVTMPLAYRDDAHRQEVQSKVARFWSSLAVEWVKSEFTAEYNSVKHGLRAGMHGSTMAMGLEDSPGVAAPPERMVVFAQSEFGLHFYVPEEIFSDSSAGKRDKLNIKLVDVNNNWNPERFVVLLELLAMSINNVIAYLKLQSGARGSDLQWQIPEDMSIFDNLWQYRAGTSRFAIGSNWDMTGLKPFTKADVEAYYATVATAPSTPPTSPTAPTTPIAN